MEKTTEQKANEIINLMDDAGLTPDQMLEVIALARKKYELLKSRFEITCPYCDRNFTTTLNPSKYDGVVICPNCKESVLVENSIST